MMHDYALIGLAVTILTIIFGVMSVAPLLVRSADELAAPGGGFSDRNRQSSEVSADAATMACPFPEMHERTK
jgi:hypothetical protein